MTHALLGTVGLMLAGAFLLWVGELVMDRRKAHGLCGGHGCAFCEYTGKKHRSRVARWLRRRKP